MAANPEEYEQMISVLQEFCAQTQERCDEISSAGQDCVDNMEDDPAAAKANASVQKCVGNIQSALETIRQVIEGLQSELDSIMAAAAKADSLSN